MSIESYKRSIESEKREIEGYKKQIASIRQDITSIREQKSRKAEKPKATNPELVVQAAVTKKL